MPIYITSDTPAISKYPIIHVGDFGQKEYLLSYLITKYGQAGAAQIINAVKQGEIGAISEMIKTYFEILGNASKGGHVILLAGNNDVQMYRIALAKIQTAWIKEFLETKDKEKLRERLMELYQHEGIANFLVCMLGILGDRIKILLEKEKYTLDNLFLASTNFKKIRIDNKEYIVAFPDIFEYDGKTFVTWGEGAGAGGVMGLKEELDQIIAGNKEFPLSQRVSPILPYAPIYSGYSYYKELKKILEECRRQGKKVYLISHVPPYLGSWKDIVKEAEQFGWKREDLESMIEKAYGKEVLDKMKRFEKIGDLDVVSKSNIQGYDFKQPTHAGDIFLRLIIEKYKHIIKGIYFGHIEEHGGKSTNYSNIKICNVAGNPYYIT